MVKLTERISMETQSQLLKKMLEDISQELAHKYENKIVVDRSIPDSELEEPSWYIAEQKDKKNTLREMFNAKLHGERLLGTERMHILIVREGFLGGAYGKKVMHVCIIDNKAEAVIKKYLEPYAEKYGITEIEFEK